MRADRFRWDLVLAALLLAAAIVVHGIMGRWSRVSDRNILDRATGRVCAFVEAARGYVCFDAPIEWREARDRMTVDVDSLWRR